MDETKFRKNFGKNLNSLRKEKGITQFELAEKLNYSDKAISKWERGESVPDSFTVYKLAEFFGVSVDYFFSGENEGTNKNNTGIHLSAKARSVRAFVPFMSVMGIFFIASVFFFVMKNVSAWSDYAYYPFIYSVPLSSIVLTVFSSIWWNRASSCVCASALVWSSAVAVYSSIPSENIKYIFVCCIILQALLILAYIFGHFFSKK